MISYEVSQKELTGIINNLAGIEKTLFNPAILEKLAVDIKQRIKLRTQSGKDKKNKPFKKYSAGYAIKEGKDLVNLTQTAGMLNSMTQKAMSNEVVKIFFSNKRARELADIHINKGAGKGKVIRDFFGVNEKDREFAFSSYRKATAGELAKRGVS